jgi:hypothetical protein
VAGKPHIDMVPSNNLYRLHVGTKKVRIVPKEFTHLAALKVGIDNLYTSSESLDGLSGVWEIDLNAGDVIIFNSGGCIHSFENTSPYTLGESIRFANLFYTDINVLKTMLFDTSVTRNYVRALQTSIGLRNADKV